MAQQQIPGPAHTVVQGMIEGVPCPHCGKKNDLRELEQQQLLDTGHQIACDFCQRSMEVTAIRKATIVAVRKTDPNAMRGNAGRRPPPRPMQQPQLAAPQGMMAGIKRLLGGPKR